MPRKQIDVTDLLDIIPSSAINNFAWSVHSSSRRFVTRHLRDRWEVETREAIREMYPAEDWDLYITFDTPRRIWQRTTLWANVMPAVQPRRSSSVSS